MNSDAESGEVEAGWSVDLAADAGGEEVLAGPVAIDARWGGAAGEVGVESGVGGVACGAGELGCCFESAVVGGFVEVRYVGADRCCEVVVEEDVEEVVGVVVAVRGPTDVGEVEGFALGVKSRVQLRESVEGVDGEMDPDRGEVVRQDLRPCGESGGVDGVEDGGSVLIAGELACLGEVGFVEWIDLVVAVARDAGWQILVGGQPV